MSDDFDEIVDRIRKFFNFKSEAFDVDFLVFPEATEDLNLKFGDEGVEGFKVSYHFESGMEKPEIKIEGDFDERKLNEYLDQFNLDQSAHVQDNGHHVQKDVVDAGLQLQIGQVDVMGQVVFDPGIQFIRAKQSGSGDIFVGHANDADLTAFHDGQGSWLDHLPD